MGLFGNPDAVISNDQFFFLDSDTKKLAICTEAGGRIASGFGGMVKLRDGGDEVHVTGQYGGFAVRFVVWVTFANLRVQVKTRQPLRLQERVHIAFDDEDPALAQAEQLGRDEWDAGTEQKVFLAPRFCLEGDGSELQQMRGAWDQLPHQITAGVLSLLAIAPKSGTSFTLSDDQVEVYLNDATIPLSKTAGVRATSILNLLVATAAAAEERFGGAAPVPYGQPAAQQYAAPAAQPFAPAPPPGAPPPAGGLGPGSRVLVTWSDGNRYPASVVQVATGQCLCAFSNGQQHWIAMQWVTPQST
jgi:hypothetical protein